MRGRAALLNRNKFGLEKSYYSNEIQLQINKRD